jgi:hypothetical protein
MIFRSTKENLQKVVDLISGFEISFVWSYCQLSIGLQKMKMQILQRALGTKHINGIRVKRCSRKTKFILPGIFLTLKVDYKKQWCSGLYS